MSGVRRGGFNPIPQEEHVSEQQPERKWTPKSDFRSQVQQVLRQSAIQQENGQESTRTSPAFSDTTLISGDYFEVPLRSHEANTGEYVEYCGGYYGPEVVGLSPISSARAGLGLEVHSEPAAPYLSSGGLPVDDNCHSISYCGSEGKTDEEDKHEKRNYKPLCLRGYILLGLFLSLAVLIVLAELAIQRLPNDSGINPFSEEYEHTAKIYHRLNPETKSHVPSNLAHFKRHNETRPVTTTSTPTEITSHTIPETTPSSSLTSQITTVPPVGGGTKTEISTSSPTVPVIIPSPDPQPPLQTSTSKVPPSPSPSSEDNPSPSVTSSSKYSPSPPFTWPAPPSISSTLESSPTVTSTGTREPTGPHESSSSENQWPWPSSNHPGHPDHSGQPPILVHPDHSGQPPIPVPPTSRLPSSDETSMLSTPSSSSRPTAPDPPTGDDPTRSKHTLTSSTGSDSTPTGPKTTIRTKLPSPSPPPPPPSPTSSSVTKPSPPSTSTTGLPFSTSTGPLGTATESPGTTTRLPISSSSIQSSSTITSSTTTSSTTTTAKTTEEFPSSPPAQTEHASSRSLTSEKTSIKTGTTASNTRYTFDYLSSTNSEPQAMTLSPSSTTAAIIPTRILQPSSSVSKTTETELPEPFLTITNIPDRPSPSKPIITTTITTSTTQDGVAFITTFVKGIKAELDDSVTKYVSTYTDSDGRPTRTETIWAQASTETIVYKDSHGNPTRTGTQIVLRYPRKTTLTDYQGRATLTRDYYVGLSSEVLYDDDGHPTATKTSMVTEVAMPTTLFNGNGVATLTTTDLVPLSLTTTVIATPTSEVSPNAKDQKALSIVPISNGKYFLGLMLPTFIAIAVSISIRMVDQNARLYHPFHALTATRGALARDTLCFQTSSIWNIKGRFRSLLNGESLLALTGLLVLGSVIMVPLTSESVRIILGGPNCAGPGGDSSVCTMALGVNLVPAQVAVALLAFMTILVGITAIVLRKWNTGLSWNPWSLFHMGHLAANNEIRTLLLRRLREKDGRMTYEYVTKALKGVSFILDSYRDNGELKYGLLIPNEVQPLRGGGKSVAFAGGKASQRRRKGDYMPFFILTWTGKLLFLALLCGMVIGLMIYTIMGDGQDYTQFMTGRWRVVRFIFTTIGVLISIIWGSFFYAVAFLSPHKLLHRIRLYNGEAVYMTPPTNPFTGIWSSLAPGRRDVYLGLVCATSILSEILPLLLSTALDKCTEGFWAHTVCLWMAVGVLTTMISVVGFSFFVTWPHMPIDPSTVAGEMYYALTNFASMSPSAGLLFGKANPGLV
ncbi:hypothetical protein F5Y00DRAFT_274197 [Daldinia vernicosa]|uniref:uncharacterized protein n=1 Tax=Daldinia vernicosa TaxID=114800 RepID=UPI0020083ACD|nr:uncharacterized protein F5Y00DRAFT_274197 [Daldinia vernicosa]KAI0851920.1 hypothetical protein F5Y00DRAFT_274197 [Daldinia vernicosa]